MKSILFISIFLHLHSINGQIITQTANQQNADQKKNSLLHIKSVTESLSTDKMAHSIHIKYFEQEGKLVKEIFTTGLNDSSVHNYFYQDNVLIREELFDNTGQSTITYYEYNANGNPVNKRAEGVQNFYCTFNYNDQNQVSGMLCFNGLNNNDGAKQEVIKNSDTILAEDYFYNDNGLVSKIIVDENYDVLYEILLEYNKDQTLNIYRTAYTEEEFGLRIPEFDNTYFYNKKGMLIRIESMSKKTGDIFTYNYSYELY